MCTNKFLEVTMLKLLKHDLKNNLKLCLISLIVGLLGNGLLYVLFKNSVIANAQTLGFVEMLFLILCILAVFGSFLALTVQIVMVFRRDYYSDRGYLMFTLPVKSNDILMSKLLFALIWTVIFAIAFSLINFLGMYFVGESKFLEFIKLAMNNPYYQVTPFTIISMVIYFLCNSFIGYIVMYFSIVATKSLFPSNKTGYSWIIIMIVINVVISLIDQEIFLRVPYIISYIGEGIVNAKDVVLAAPGDTITMNTFTKVMGIPISSTIIWILTGLGLYQASIKMMDNSIDI